LRAVLNDLATVVPAWLSTVTQPEWLGRRIEEYRLPRAKAAREAYAGQVGQDGFLLLDALESDPELVEVRARPLVSIFRTAWAQHFERLAGGCRWQPGSELPPVGERLCSPYDLESYYSDKLNVLLQRHWDTKAAKTFLTRLLGEYDVPEVIHTDQLRSYGAAIREIPILINVDHQQVISTSRCSNVIEQEHRSTRRQERSQQGFKRRKRAQEFLNLHARITNLHYHSRTSVSATTRRNNQIGS